MATMQLKTYRAATMADALAEVKKDLGRDAVILHTRTYRSGGVIGVGTRPVVEITASSGIASPAPRAGPAPRTGRDENSLPQRARDDESVTRPVDDPLGFIEFKPRSLGTSADAALAFALPSQAPHLATPQAAPPRPNLGGVDAPGRPAPVVGAPALGPKAVHPSRDPLSTPAPLRPTGESARAALEDELASIKTLVGEVLRVTRVTHRRAALDDDRSEDVSFAGRSGDRIALPRALMREYLGLIDAGVDEPIAESLASGVRDELSPSELDDAAIVRASLLRAIGVRLPVTPAHTAPNATASPRTIALTGPTGVGKTTTLAKLAATFKLRHGRSVGLITCDTYRIAAVEQLRTYAGIIGVPLRVAMTPAEMADAREAFRDRDLVLVDTPGRAPGDSPRLEELRAFIGSSEADEVHLTLSAAAGPASLARAIDRFRGIGARSLIVTKLDEAGASGPLLNIAVRAKLPLSYVTMGQEVPDDMEAADPSRLARRVLRGSDPAAIGPDTRAHFGPYAGDRPPVPSLAEVPAW